MTRGLFIGRFQPYHNGHHTVIKDVAADVDVLVVGVGSADKSHTSKNPFTAGERVAMIRNAGRTIEGADIVPVPIIDVDRNAIWVSHVESLCPPFDRVYTNNALVRQLFTERGYQVEGTQMYNRKNLSGTKVRDLMLDHDDDTWKDFVPDSAINIIHSESLMYRIKTVSDSDES